MVHTDHHGKGSYRPTTKPSQTSIRKARPKQETPPVVTLSEKLTRNALESQYIDLFWNLYLPKPVTFSFWKPSSIHHEAKWAEYTSNSAPQSAILKCALSALSASKVGRDTRDRDLTRRGIELYGKALMMLSKELKSPGDAKPFGVLNCCRILALYEVRSSWQQTHNLTCFQQINDVGASAENWKGHISGLLNLVRLRSPEDFSHPGTHELFLEARYNGTIAALSARTGTFLSGAEWMTKPWSNRSKDAIDMAMDVLVQIPGVLEEWETISARPENSEDHAKLDLFVTHCSNINRELRAWYGQFIIICEERDPSCTEALRRGLDNPAQQVHLPDILAQAGLHRLYAMTIYWTSCAILRATMDLVFHKYSETLFPRLGEHQAANSDILKYCICIALSAKYFLKPDFGLFTTLSLSHAGTCLVRMLADHRNCYPNVDTNDVEELKRLMDLVQGSGGFDAWVTWKCGMDDSSLRKRGTGPNEPVLRLCLGG